MPGRSPHPRSGRRASRTRGSASAANAIDTIAHTESRCRGSALPRSSPGLVPRQRGVRGGWSGSSPPPGVDRGQGPPVQVGRGRGRRARRRAAGSGRPARRRPARSSRPWSRSRVPVVNALARTIAICGSSHPRIGDHRVADGTPGARSCGSNTATGPARPRAVRVAVRLSGRVLVVITAPGASRIDGMTRCRPLPRAVGPGPRRSPPRRRSSPARVTGPTGNQHPPPTASAWTAATWRPGEPMPDAPPTRQPPAGRPPPDTSLRRRPKAPRKNGPTPRPRGQPQPERQHRPPSTTSTATVGRPADPTPRTGPRCGPPPGPQAAARAAGWGCRTGHTTTTSPPRAGAGRNRNPARSRPPPCRDPRPDQRHHAIESETESPNRCPCPENRASGAPWAATTLTPANRTGLTTKLSGPWHELA